jgi:hypothetical protein
VGERKVSLSKISLGLSVIPTVLVTKPGANKLVIKRMETTIETNFFIFVPFKKHSKNY